MKGGVGEGWEGGDGREGGERGVSLLDLYSPRFKLNPSTDCLILEVKHVINEET